MALSLNSPVLETTTRSGLAVDLQGQIDSGGTPNIQLHDNGGLGELVEFDLDATLAFTESNGVLTLDVTPAISATAGAGSATTPNQWRLLSGGGTLLITGSISGTGPITSGDTVNLTSMTITVPAS